MKIVQAPVLFPMPLKRFIVPLGMALFLAGCGSSSTLTAPVSMSQAPGRAAAAGTYAVQRGDTIYSVSRQLNVSVRALIDANNLQPPFQLTAGQVLMLPGTGFYVVAKDDTLLGVAHKTGVPFSTLARINNLSAPYVLKVGQRLKLPAAGGETTLAAAVPVAEPVRPTVSQPTPLPPPATSATSSATGASGAAGGSERAAGGYSPVSERENKGSTIIPPPPPPPGGGAPVASGSSAGTGSPSGGSSSTGSAAPAVAAAAVAATADAGGSTPAEQKALAEQKVAAAAPAPLPPTPPVPSGKGFVWPAKGPLLAEFGTTGKGQHNDGINIAVPRGTPVVAAQDGVVAYAGNELRGFGNLLLIKHSDGWMTAYAHNDTLLVKRGDGVRRGQEIAKAGDSGGVSQPQVHFEIRHGTRAVDPLGFLGGKVMPAASTLDQPDPG
jgi:murein DD-endopeptidase MepM/ murein hydrolase activator NlpD